MLWSWDLPWPLLPSGRWEHWKTDPVNCDVQISNLKCIQMLFFCFNMASFCGFNIFMVSRPLLETANVNFDSPWRPSSAVRQTAASSFSCDDAPRNLEVVAGSTFRLLVDGGNRLTEGRISISFSCCCYVFLIYQVFLFFNGIRCRSAGFTLKISKNWIRQSAHFWHHLGPCGKVGPSWTAAPSALCFKFDWSFRHRETHHRSWVQELVEIPWQVEMPKHDLESLFFRTDEWSCTAGVSQPTTCAETSPFKPLLMEWHEPKQPKCVDTSHETQKLQHVITENTDYRNRPRKFYLVALLSISSAHVTPIEFWHDCAQA